MKHLRKPRAAETTTIQIKPLFRTKATIFSKLLAKKHHCYLFRPNLKAALSRVPPRKRYLFLISVIPLTMVNNIRDTKSLAKNTVIIVVI